MSEEQIGGKAAGGPDPAAHLALAAAGATEEAREYLRRQSRLTELQIEELRKEDRIRHRALRLHHFSEFMRAALELFIGLVVLSLIVIVGAAVWSAAHDNGLVIESFSVPPDMAQKGLTGQVIASRMLDKLFDFQTKTVSNRAPSSYANNWGDDIKVQIPDTGVSIGEFNRFLRSALGHETHITGEIYRTQTGIAVTARAGSETSATFTGNETDLDALVQSAAEAVYRVTQPYRYAVYLMNANRTKEAEAAFDELIANGSRQDRAWALIGVSNIYGNRGEFERALRSLRQALELRPGFIMAYINIGGFETQLQHDEAGLAAQRKIVALGDSLTDPDVSERGVRIGVPSGQAQLAGDLGDFPGQIAFDRQVRSQPEFSGLVEGARMNDATALAFLHDAAAVERAFAELPPSSDPAVLLPRTGNRALCELQLGRWWNFLKQGAVLEEALGKIGPIGTMLVQRALWPNEAYALALSGDFAAADRLIAKTPTDCTICLRMRGRIAAVERKWPTADYWFARAVADAPSPPFAYTDWGQMLLAKGDHDGAIAKFTIANQKGPHFADPLEMWGEALLLKNRADLALARFAEAARYAPNWGRLHLKWGEALFWTGDKDGAKKQFATAAGLDLSAADRAALARVQALH